VEGLALPDTIVTVPEPTLAAFAAHGTPRLAELDEAALASRLQSINAAGIDLDAVAGELLAAGLRAFNASYAEVLDTLSTLAPQWEPSAR
jgi:transaldolase